MTIGTLQEILSRQKPVAIGLYGAGGFGREVMPLLAAYEAALKRDCPALDVTLYFVESAPTCTHINGYALLSEDDFFNLKGVVRFFNIAIAASKDRQRIAEKCMARGAKPIQITAADRLIYDQNDIDVGGIFCAGTIVTSNARIGKFFHANLHSYIAHDCVIGDYVTFAPKVCCNGNVHIGDHAYIGTGALIRPGSLEKPLLIGEGAIIGMGAVVTRDVPAYTTVMGNPARARESVRAL